MIKKLNENKSVKKEAEKKPVLIHEAWVSSLKYSNSSSFTKAEKVKEPLTEAAKKLAIMILEGKSAEAKDKQLSIISKLTKGIYKLNEEDVAKLEKLCSKKKETKDVEEKDEKTVANYFSKKTQGSSENPVTTSKKAEGEGSSGGLDAKVAPSGIKSLNKQHSNDEKNPSIFKLSKGTWNESVEYTSKSNKKQKDLGLNNGKKIVNKTPPQEAGKGAKTMCDWSWKVKKLQNKFVDIQKGIETINDWASKKSVNKVTDSAKVTSMSDWANAVKKLNNKFEDIKNDITNINQWADKKSKNKISGLNRKGAEDINAWAGKKKRVNEAFFANGEEGGSDNKEVIEKIVKQIVNDDNKEVFEKNKENFLKILNDLVEQIKGENPDKNKVKEDIINIEKIGNPELKPETITDEVLNKTVDIVKAALGK